MRREPPHSVRCFVVLHDGVGRPFRCPNPVRWHGLVRSGTAHSYRAFSCDDHSQELESRMPVTHRLNVGRPAERVVPLRWERTEPGPRSAS